jgi:SAM-dependent methyltransferase
MAQAAERWREDLASWAIPQEILDRAPESPWHFPVQLFTSRADVSGREPTPSDRRASEALAAGGSVLDVGCGAGAASLPLAPKASRLIGVDGSSEMLEEFDLRAAGAGVASTAVEGRWPDVAGDVPVADVVVCHHVFYNAPDLPQFARALTDHARTRVVAELTGTHPMSNFNELWLRFHGVVRPTRPTADDAVAVLEEIGVQPHREDWVAKRRGGFERREDAVAWVRRLLCLPAERDPEVAAALEDWLAESEGRVGPPDRPVVTLWWEGTAQ